MAKVSKSYRLTFLLKLFWDILVHILPEANIQWKIFWLQIKIWEGDETLHEDDDDDDLMMIDDDFWFFLGGGDFQNLSNINCWMFFYGFKISNYGSEICMQR